MIEKRSEALRNSRKDRRINLALTRREAHRTIGPVPLDVLELGLDMFGRAASPRQQTRGIKICSYARRCA